MATARFAALLSEPPLHVYTPQVSTTKEIFQSSVPGKSSPAEFQTKADVEDVGASQGHEASQASQLTSAYSASQTRRISCIALPIYQTEGCLLALHGLHACAPLCVEQIGTVGFHCRACRHAAPQRAHLHSGALWIWGSGESIRASSCHKRQATRHGDWWEFGLPIQSRHAHHIAHGILKRFPTMTFMALFETGFQYGVFVFCEMPPQNPMLAVISF